jgi:tRNA threonylcarbamoyl adenosine modification protein YeaZ
MSNILYLKADSENVSIYISQDNETIASKDWRAGRELSVQILNVINELCVASKITLNDLDGIVVYQGPGSYTGLRISISVANAIGYSLQIPVVGAGGDNWQAEALGILKKNINYKSVSPIYGGDVFTTKPIK